MTRRQPSATRPAVTHPCDRCGQDLARFFFSGWLCDNCAPSEAQIRAHAIRVFRARRRRGQPLTRRQT